MHTHGTQTNLNSVNPYTQAAEKATASQRAANVRKKLRKSARDIERIASPEEASLLAQWMTGQQLQNQSEVEYHTAASGKDSDFG